MNKIKKCQKTKSCKGYPEYHIEVDFPSKYWDEPPELNEEFSFYNICDYHSNMIELRYIKKGIKYQFLKIRDIGFIMRKLLNNQGEN